MNKVRVVVVGAGVVGVTTAYYLARDGVDVALVEAADQIAPETSRTNGSLIAPGHSFAWASPAAPRLLARSLLGREASIGVRLPPDPRLIAWGARFLRNCTADRAERNSVAKLRLARFSQGALEELIEVERIECHYRKAGILYLYRSPEEYEAGKRRMQLMRQHGQQMVELTPSEIGDAEPALAASATRYAGALLGVTDTTADSLTFSRALVERCRALGVEVHLGTRARGVALARGRVVAVRTSGDAIPCDGVVVAAGAYSARFRIPGARPVPVYPARGYAMDVPVLDPSRAPVAGGLDERRLVAWAPAGEMVRLAAVAEFAGFDRRIGTNGHATITRTGREVFGDALDWARANLRVGFRPMTPDGPPIIGPSRVPGVWYNTGHGHMGWTMACGSARLLCDLMLDRPPELDVSALLPRSGRW
jgi:D-amino-acid dehydrogenase